MYRKRHKVPSTQRVTRSQAGEVGEAITSAALENIEVEENLRAQAGGDTDIHAGEIVLSKKYSYCSTFHFAVLNLDDIFYDYFRNK